MSNQHGSGGLSVSLGRKFLIFCGVYCFSLWRLHSVLSLEEEKQSVLHTVIQKEEAITVEKSDISLTHDTPMKLQDKLDEEFRLHGRPYDGEDLLTRSAEMTPKLNVSICILGNLWDLSDLLPAWMKGQQILNRNP